MTVRDLIQKLLEYDINSEVIINTSSALVAICPHCKRCMVEHCPRCGDPVGQDEALAECEELYPYDLTKEVNGRVQVIIKAEHDARKVTR